MRRVYVVKEVGDDCETCSSRSGDDCRLFNERLYSRHKPGGLSHNPTGVEYLMLEACRNGEHPPMHFKPGVR